MHLNTHKPVSSFFSFEEIDGNLKIIYQDDGLGFPKDIESKGLGLGMSNVETRVQVLKGEWHIDHQKENGAEIQINIPI